MISRIESFGYAGDQYEEEQHSKPNHDCKFWGCEVRFEDGKSYVGTLSASQLRAVLENYYYVSDKWKSDTECFLHRCIVKVNPDPNPENLIGKLYSEAVRFK